MGRFLAYLNGSRQRYPHFDEVRLLYCYVPPSLENNKHWLYDLPRLIRLRAAKDQQLVDLSLSATITAIDSLHFMI